MAAVPPELLGMDCPDLECLAEHVDDELDSEVRAEIDRHLECDHCGFPETETTGFLATEEVRAPQFRVGLRQSARLAIIAGSITAARVSFEASSTHSAPTLAANRLRRP